MFSSKKGSSRRRTILLTAGGVAVVVAVGVTVGVIVTQTGDDGPTNAASCSDVEFIGVAGSGQRDGGDSAEDQMDEEDIEDEDYGDSETPDVDVVAEVGDIVAVTYANLEADLPEDTSINLRAVEYPAIGRAGEPEAGDVGGLLRVRRRGCLSNKGHNQRHRRRVPGIKDRRRRVLPGCDGSATRTA